MARPLFTIGYEGKTQDELLRELQEAGVALVIDVRAVASSRRPGFSKTALAGALRERGIDYLHLRPLGTPAAGREAARKGRAEEMRAIYAGQLELPEAQAAVAILLDRIDAQPTAILCYEREPADCHRTLLIAAVARDAEVVDLFA